MKKLSLVLLIAVILALGGVATLSTPSYAQFNIYITPPANMYAQPWVGSSTPWVYYNGDWFLNGVLYYFFGPQYGWAPYYAYPTTYIVRPRGWYGSRWQGWYRGHPHYWNNFRRTYPYWHKHRVGHRYDQRFYERHRHGAPGGWHKGYHGHPAAPVRPGGPKPGHVKPGHKPPPGHFPPGHKPGPGHVAPPSGHKPGPGHVVPPSGHKPGPGRVAPPSGHKPGPGRVAPPSGHKPGPGRVAPPSGHRPGAPHAAPHGGPKPAPGRAAPPAKKKPTAPGPTTQHERGHQR
jgi:hypothetical protein